MQAWALNRYYYQAMIPIKDASLIARCEDSAIRREWRSRLRRPRRRARRRRRHRALAQAHRRARARPRLCHVAARPAARHALRRRGLCAFRAREDAARGDRLLADRTVLAGDHQRAHRGHAGGLRFRHARDARLFRASARRRRSAIPISRSTTSSATRARRSSSRRCWPRSNSNAACCGRCSTRCITPMSRPGQFRPARSCRRTDEMARERRAARDPPTRDRGCRAACGSRTTRRRAAGCCWRRSACSRRTPSPPRSSSAAPARRRSPRSSTISPKTFNAPRERILTDVTALLRGLAEKKLLEL